MIRIVQEQLDAYNDRDLERFLACYADDVVMTGADGTPMMRGIAQLRDAYGALFANSPNLKADRRSLPCRRVRGG